MSFKLPQVEQKRKRSEYSVPCLYEIGSAYNMEYFGNKCSEVLNSNRIVISIEQQKHVGDWKDLQEAEQISNRHPCSVQS